MADLYNPLPSPYAYRSPVLAAGTETPLVVGGYGVSAPPEDVPEVQLGIDAPTFTSLPGTIIVLFFVMTIVSLLICIGRTDFNLVVYLLGYYTWCIESEASRILSNSSHDTGGLKSTWVTPYVSTRKTYKSVQYLTAVLAVVSLVDASWLLIAFASWTCKNGEELSATGSCFTKENYRLEMLLPMHKFVLVLSAFNLVAKISAAVLSLIWISSQSKVLHHSEEGSWAIQQGF